MADQLEASTDLAQPPALEIAWRPTQEYMQRSRLRRFMERHGIPDLESLLRRSTEDLDWFWRAVSDDQPIGRQSAGRNIPT